MSQATFRFYAELNDFLPKNRRFTTFAVPFELPASVKHMIESLGVTHTEVDLILANGEPVDFGYIVQDGDRISVYPMFESLDISPASRLRPEPLRSPRFVLDAHLGRLAVYLRMLGFDSLYRNDYADEELAIVSSQENRILLTRDRGLLKRSLVSRGYYVRGLDPRRQAMEVVQRFDLQRAFKPFTRCLRCNGLLEPAQEEEIAGQLLPGTQKYFHEFSRCRSCGHVYWKGAHYQRMLTLIKSISSEQ
jgi:uncharacterized protein with PIN domain